MNRKNTKCSHEPSFFAFNEQMPLCSQFVSVSFPFRFISFISNEMRSIQKQQQQEKATWTPAVAKVYLCNAFWPFDIEMCMRSFPLSFDVNSLQWMQFIRLFILFCALCFVFGVYALQRIHALSPLKSVCFHSVLLTSFQT